MGVTYKLKDEVVHFIISQRQGNPFFSCRQLAESAYQRFGLKLSKSSVHDVLKESGIMTPRGRKPKDKFKIPQEKKKQIQSSLSQVKLLPAPIENAVDSQPPQLISVIGAQDNVPLNPDVILMPSPLEELPSAAVQETDVHEDLLKNDEFEISPEYDGAGNIFLKAVRWDLGVFSEGEIKESDWDYYLTYSKGIKVVLENSKEFFIELPLPIERCIREAADGLVSNVKPLIVHGVSDEELFKACMAGQEGYKIKNILIVDQKNHEMTELSSIVDIKRQFYIINRHFVECNKKDPLERLKLIFFSQYLNNDDAITDVLSLKGFDRVNRNDNIVTLLIQDGYSNPMLQEAVDNLNGMFLRDEQNRLVKIDVKIK